jgi:hypothetical protein
LQFFFRVVYILYCFLHKKDFFFSPHVANVPLSTLCKLWRTHRSEGMRKCVHSSDVLIEVTY